MFYCLNDPFYVELIVVPKIELYQKYVYVRLFIALPGLIYLSDKLIMNFDWCTYNLQSHTFVLLVKIATKILNSAPKWGLVV